MVDLKPLEQEDAQIVFEWQSDPQTRRYFRNPKPPAWEGHESWISAMISSEEDQLFVMQYDAQSAGLLRLSLWPEDRAIFEISLLVAPGFYGQGIATAALDSMAAIFPNAAFIADIHQDNTASIRVFEKTGFSKKAEQADKPWLRYEKDGVHV